MRHNDRPLWQPLSLAAAALAFTVAISLLAGTGHLGGLPNWLKANAFAFPFLLTGCLYVTIQIVLLFYTYHLFKMASTANQNSERFHRVTSMPMVIAVITAGNVSIDSQGVTSSAIIAPSTPATDESGELPNSLQAVVKPIRVEIKNVGSGTAFALTVIVQNGYREIETLVDKDGNLMGSAPSKEAEIIGFPARQRIVALGTGEQKAIALGTLITNRPPSAMLLLRITIEYFDLYQGECVTMLEWELQQKVIYDESGSPDISDNEFEISNPEILKLELPLPNATRPFFPYFKVDSPSGFYADAQEKSAAGRNIF